MQKSHLRSDGRPLNSLESFSSQRICTFPKYLRSCSPAYVLSLTQTLTKVKKKNKKDTHISMAPDKHCQITFQLVALRDHIRSWLLPPRGFRAAPSFPTVTRCPGFGGRPISAPPTSCLAPAAQFWRYGQACVFWLSAAPVHVRLHVTQTDTATSASPPLSSRQGPRRIQSRPEPGE